MRTDYIFVAYVRYAPGVEWVELARTSSTDKSESWEMCYCLALGEFQRQAKLGRFFASEASWCILPYPEQPYAFNWAKRRRR